MRNLLVNLEQFLSALWILLKEYIAYWWTLQIFFSVTHDMTIHTAHLLIISASCHHAKHIYCKTTESWDLWSHHTWWCHYILASHNVTTFLHLRSWKMSLRHYILAPQAAHVIFTCIWSRFSYPHKEFLILLCTVFNPHLSHTSE